MSAPNFFEADFFYSFSIRSLENQLRTELKLSRQARRGRSAENGVGQRSSSRQSRADGGKLRGVEKIETFRTQL